MRTTLWKFCLLGDTGSAGCVGGSTPATRICANPEAFDRVTTRPQALVKAGHLALGFDTEAVERKGGRASAFAEDWSS